MISIPSAENWRKIVSRGRYPLILINELCQGLRKTHLVTGTKARLKSYCRVTGASFIYEPEAREVIKEFKNILKKRPKLTLVWLKRYHALVKNLYIWLSGSLKEVDEQGDISLSRLKKLFLSYEKYCQTFWRWGYYNFLLDEVIFEGLSEILSGLGFAPDKLPEIVKILTISSKNTLHQQEDDELLRLAIEVKRRGLGTGQRKLEAHAVKWAWKNSWLYFQEPLNLNDFKKEILALAKGDPEKALKKSQEKRQNELKTKAALLRKFADRRLITLAEILSEYAYWHSLKMEEMTRIIYLARPLLEKLAEKLNLTYQELIELMPSEITSGRFNKKIINSRFKDNGLLSFNNKLYVLSGRELVKVKNNFLSLTPKVNLIKGYSVSPGTAKGRVVIVQAKAAMAKVSFPEGSILVTTMTTVNMTSLAKKAAAIVTDEGGILSHAAIISRELEKPCVIGTKIATKVLRNGDLVEVDADRGAVKLIK